MAKNIIPEAKLVATVEGKKITLELSGTDASKHGSIQGYSITQDSGPNVEILNSNSSTGTIENAPGGDYVFRGEVLDNRNAWSEPVYADVTIEVQTSGPIIYGAIVADGSSDEKVAVVKAIGGKIIRFTEEVSTTTGKIHTFDNALAAGLSVCLGFAWKSLGGSATNQFVRPAEYDKYRTNLRKIFDNYKPEVAICENEETVDVFWGSDDIKYYLDQLAVFVEVCKSYNIKCADGAIHTPFIEQVARSNGKTLTGNAGQVQKVIDAVVHMGTDYWNIHANSDGQSVPPDFISVSADYLRSRKNMPVMSNEWHLATASTQLMKTFMQAWVNGKVKYCIIYTSHSGKNAPINNIPFNGEKDLTAIGVEMKNFIKG